MKQETLHNRVLLFAISICFSILSLTTVSQPSYDTPCGALSVGATSLSYEFTNVDATTDPGEVLPPSGTSASSCASQDGWCATSLTLENSIWFEFVAPPSGNVTVSTCNEGTNVDTQIAIYEAEFCYDYSSFTLIGANDDLTGCLQSYASSLTSCLVPGNPYFLQIDGFSGSTGDIFLSITPGPDDDCIDCTLLGVDVGDSCDDGDPTTSGDVVTNECICAGNVPCQNESAYETFSFDGSTQEYTDYCAFEQEYNTFQNIESGKTYIFTSEDIYGAGGYMTIRRDSYDGPVVTFGYSPLSVISPTDGDLFVHYNTNGMCGTADNCVIVTGQCVTCLEYCVLFDAIEGDPCDDGDPSTINDAYTSDCECHGEEPCLNSNPYFTQTFDGTDLALFTTCTYAGEYNTYENSVLGSEYTFSALDEGNPRFITIRSGTFDGAVLGYGFSPVTVTSNINGALYAHISTDGICSVQTTCLDVTAQCTSCPHYCPDLDLIEGTPCDDGDPDTTDDVVTSDCICQGSQPCQNILPYTTYNLDGTNLVHSSACTYEEEYNTFTNAESGNTYTFTSEDNFGVDGFITIRSGTFDGTVLGYGYSPVSVTSDIDGSLFVHYNVNGACETFDDCVNITGQCISCPVYCPILDMTAGDPCDDGDEGTINDAITSDCECHGEQECLHTFNWDSRTFDGTDVQLTIFGNLSGDYNTYNNSEAGHQYTFTTSNTSTPNFITVTSGTFDGDVLGFGFSPLTVTSDINGPIFAHFSSDGVCGLGGGSFNTIAQCITCPHYCEELGLTEGAPCDDGDPNTNFDRITVDCECAGNLPCVDTEAWGEIILSGTSELQEIIDCNYAGDYNTIFNAFEGDQYTFSSAHLTGDFHAYITVRSGTFDGPVVGMGFSPLTITSDIDGTLFTHITYNEFCDIIQNGCLISTVQCTTCDYDCPSIGADIGDSCDDGNANTVQDEINGDCNCAGVIPPANDTCDNAQELIVSTPGDCLANQVIGSTIGASQEFDFFSCDFGGTFADVFYAFNSGNYNEVLIEISDISQGDVVVEISDVCNGPIIFCDVGISQNISLTVTPETDYLVRVGPNLSYGNPGIFSICIEGVYDCPILLANIGDPCDDGTSSTINDLVTPLCECEGTVFYDCPDLGLNIGDACNDFDPNTIADIVTPSCDCIGTSIFDCPVLEANIGDSCDDGDPDTDSDMVDAGCNCVGTITYDCPALSLNIGDACNDGNPDTENDMVSGLCVCEGTTIFDCPVLSLNIGDACNDGNPDTENDMVDAGCNCVGTIIYDCPALSLNIGDACNDGDPGTENDMVDAGCNCVGTIIYDCPALSLNIGDACNDGDPGTENDMVDAGCNCVGTIIYDCPALSLNIGDACDDGDANTINDEISPTCTCEGELAGDASLTGTADWNTSCSSRPMEIAMYNAGTSTLVATLGFDINSDGTFATTMDYLGTFDIYIKIDGYLRKGFYNYSMGIGENTLDIGELTPGELNGDDGVNIADVSVVNASFGSVIGDGNYNLIADMNCDGGINIVDVSILNANFGLVGVMLP